MSLDYNLKEIPEEVTTYKRKPLPSEGKVDPELLDEDGNATYLNPITEFLIWQTISIKIGRWTRENIGEVIARIYALRALDGLNEIIEDGKPRVVTDDEIIAHIGLSCNVANESRTQFLRNVTRRMDEIKNHVNRQIEKDNDDE